MTRPALTLVRSETDLAYDGAVPEFDAQDVENAFPTERFDLSDDVRRAMALALRARPNVLRSTHDLARWIEGWR